MSRLPHYWDQMYLALTKFRQEKGSCDVPANYEANPGLGRWVAVQRFRRKMGRLTAEQTARLDKLGFIWSPGDLAWERGFKALMAFKKKHGNCDVPAQDERCCHLGSWVANQRHRKKTGKLSAARVDRLEAAGFKWCIYGMQEGRRKPAKGAPPPAESARRVRKAAAAEPENRLYNLGHDTFVQYEGHGPVPREMAQYMKENDGDYPPFIPLPAEPVRFVLSSNGFGRERIVKWTGKGRLSVEILEYVQDNGCLPPRK